MPEGPQEIGQGIHRYRVLCVELAPTVFRAQAVVTVTGHNAARVEMARFTSTARTPHDAMDDVRGWALCFIGSLTWERGGGDQLDTVNETLRQRGALHTAHAGGVYTAGTGPV